MDSLPQIELFQKGSKSRLLRHTTKDENLAYAKNLRQELNDFYSEANHKINVTAYDVQRHDPLNLVVLYFCNTEKPVDVKQANELSSLLKIFHSRKGQESVCTKAVQVCVIFNQNSNILHVFKK
jgi:hypothetical protein